MRFDYGNVTIEITGYSPEKFINIAARRKIFFKNVKYIDKNKLSADVDFANFKKLRPVALKSRCRIHILKKRGKIFLLKKCLERKVFFIEGLCSIVILFLLSTLIGNIEINAPVTVSKHQILNFLYENGVSEGTFKYSIDDELLAKKLVLEFDSISWAEISIKGMELKVDVAEKVPKPDIVPYTVNCDIVAAKDGIIYSTDVKNGTEKVLVGDTVTKGDIIISGIMEDKHDENNKYLVHAHGDVLAKTWYKAEQVVNTVEINRNRTGNYVENSGIEILGLELGWFKKGNEYNDYDTVIQKDNLLLWGFIKIPVYITHEKYYECTQEAAQIDGNEAVQNAKDRAYEKCVEQITGNAEITDVKFSYKPIQNGGICVEVIVECIEDIGVAKELGYE